MRLSIWTAALLIAGAGWAESSSSVSTEIDSLDGLREDLEEQLTQVDAALDSLRKVQEEQADPPSPQPSLSPTRSARKSTSQNARNTDCFPVSPTLSRPPISADQTEPTSSDCTPPEGQAGKTLRKSTTFRSPGSSSSGRRSKDTWPARSGWVGCSCGSGRLLVLRCHDMAEHDGRLLADAIVTVGV